MNRTRIRQKKLVTFRFFIYQMIAEGDRIVNAGNRFIYVSVHLVGFTK